ncbi:hypothetical protein HQ571_03240 [Candidatus Kuenenbacteria bacterium]|nr:hypothetical protein [Candidatus Kuenenbacteria bacterium]
MNIKGMNKFLLVLIALAVVFFIIYSAFYVSVTLPLANQAEGHYIFSWPDAMANNYFIKQFALTNDFIKTEPLNVELNNVIHPRSTNVTFDGNIVPVSFLGMLIIYGWLTKFIGSYLIMFLTPLLASAMVLFFYGLIRRVFNDLIGFISALLLFGLASFWYYANLVMLPTILFIFLVISGLYFLIRIGDQVEYKYKYGFSILSGLLLSFAVITRLTEAIWIAIIVLVCFIFYRKKVELSQVLIFLVAGLVPLAILLIYNEQTYGSYFTIGYLNLSSGGAIMDRMPPELQVSGGMKIVTYLKLIFAPFGFYEKTILWNFGKYFVEFLLPYVVLCFVGGIVWLINAFKKQVTKNQVCFAVCSFLISVWLVLYYGSWEFVDLLVLENNTVGSSYVRYWLPLNILILPLIAYLLAESLKLKVYKWLKITLITVVIISLTTYSALIVYDSPGDGLVAQKKVIESYYVRAEKVNSFIENDSVIITDRADKLFFPRHQVAVFDLDYTVFSRLQTAINYKPIYYLTLRPETDINYINEKKIKSLNLQLNKFKQIDEQFNLYKLVSLD